jgi:hypothetical protein
MPRFVRVTFLRALRHTLTATFWDALARDHAGAPAALQGLARGDSSVVCDPAEAHASLESARRHWAWTESLQPVSVGTRVAAGARPLGSRAK